MCPGLRYACSVLSLSGKDIYKAVKTMYGIEDIETPVDPMKPGKCSRCGEMNASGANYCYKCGLPLTQSAYQEEQTATLTGEEILQQWIKSNPEKMVKILQGLGKKQ
jgi:integrase/recombinase XerD